MIRLFRKDETNFNHNEWVLTDTTKCLVTEITNSNFELDFEYPVQDRKDLSKYLVTGNIIKCDVGDNRGEQLFRIRKSSGDKTKTIFAQSKLIADLASNRIKAMTITGKTRKEAIQTILNAALDSHDYVVGNKDTNTNKNFIVDIKEGSVLDAIVGSENSILSTYGGEFMIDNNTIDIVDSRGTDRGFDIRYGKNIKGITPTEDDTDLATVIIPKVGDLRLPEYVVESANVSKYEKRYFKELDVQGLSIWNGEGEQGEDEITEEEAYVKMREASNLLFTKDHVDLINFTYELDLAILSKTEEYKSKAYYLMEDVFLGDTVKVKHEILDIDLYGSISKTVYNVLLGKYDSVTVGFQKQNITDIINNTIRTIKFTKQEILLQVKNLENRTNASLEIMEDEIDARVEKDEFGSYIRLNYDQVLLAVNDEKNGTDVIINVEGLEVRKGKFRMYNNNGDLIFRVNTKGLCTMVNSLEIEDSEGNTKSELSSDGVYIYSNGTKGMIVENGVLTFMGAAHFNNSVDVYDLTINGVSLNSKIDSRIPDVPEWLSDLKVGSDLDMDDYDIQNVTYIEAHKGRFSYGEITTTLDCYNLEVENSKNCVQSTEHYGKRLINAYETCSYYFGDLGEGVIGEDGIVYIFFDPIFLECVNTNVSYHCMTQVYNKKSSITDIERYPNYCILRGDPGTKFSWEIKAKRKGFENVRLELNADEKPQNII